MPIKAFDAVGYMGLDKSKMKKGLASTRLDVSKAMSGIAGLTKKAAKVIAVSIAAAFVAAGVAATAFLALSIVKFAKFGDEIEKLSIRIGAGAQALSEYQHVAEISGVSFETLAMAWQRMTRRVAEAALGTGEAVDALKELGVSAVALSALTPEKQFEALAEALRGIPGEADKVRLAMKLFDSEGVALLQIVKQDAEALRELRQEANWLGITMSQEAARGAAATTDAFSRMKKSITGILLSVGREIGPMFRGIADRGTEAFVRIRERMDDNHIAFGEFIEGLRRVSNALAETLGPEMGRILDNALRSLRSFAGESMSNVVAVIRGFRSHFLATGVLLAAAIVEGIRKGLAMVVGEMISTMIVRPVTRELENAARLIRAAGLGPDPSPWEKAYPGLSSATVPSSAPAIGVPAGVTNSQTIQHAEFNLHLPSGDPRVAAYAIHNELLNLQRTQNFNRGRLAFIP